MLRRLSRAVGLALLGLALCVGVMPARGDPMAARALVGREGAGYLERVGTQLVLHLKGTPEEMGRQHGVLLREHIRQNLTNATKKASGAGAAGLAAGGMLSDMVWKAQSRHMPPRYEKELQALADAAGIRFEEVRRANTIPEFFHCSGFAVFGKATRDGTLYHGRILDYGTDWGLQEHAVVVIAQPKGYLPFVNVTYAGFTGSVTGFNLAGVGFGEMGGGGQGKWNGTPMAYLMRRGLEEARTLSQARKLFEKSKRTCEYYYVLSDAKAPGAWGVRATPRRSSSSAPMRRRGR